MQYLKKNLSWGKNILRALTGFFFLVIIYLSICWHPEFLFSHKTASKNIVVFSDEPIHPYINVVLDSVQQRITSSPLYVEEDNFRVFICNNDNLFLFLTNRNHKAGGVNNFYLGQNTYLRKCNIKENRLIKNGKTIPGDRTLVYYMAHEICHGMTARETGILDYQSLPAWIVEGYADYIGKGKMDFEGALVKFKNGDKELDPKKSGLYLKYHLAVTFLLDRKKIPLKKMLEGKFDIREIEKELQRIDIR